MKRNEKNEWLKTTTKTGSRLAHAYYHSKDTFLSEGHHKRSRLNGNMIIGRRKFKMSKSRRYNNRKELGFRVLILGLPRVSPLLGSG